MTVIFLSEFIFYLPILWITLFYNKTICPLVEKSMVENREFVRNREEKGKKGGSLKKRESACGFLPSDDSESCRKINAFICL